ncbi:hypothetical protein QFC21_003777 [Naganishia friedmannii]|uniref:Uncharacterized protein n=1 Tax=Naganishia friedmannii TaxID=89922 RepID=A0ACC2VLA6_9TREE|nr:hypothetical protein QFC21_003777 [Naganishia friedmannii]
MSDTTILSSQPPPVESRHAAIRSVFENFRTTLDDQVPLNRAEQRERTLAEADEKVDEILAWLRKCRDDLVKGGVSYWAYARNISPGIQEFIEAISLLHYLRHASLITPEEVDERIRESKSDPRPIVPISAEDYALGISDLTGELMRYATNCSSTGDHETALHACAFVRDMKAGLDTAQPFVRDLKKKQEVTSASLEKIEKICYAIQLKILEYGDRPDVLERLAKRALEENNEEPLGGGEDTPRGGDAGSRGRGALGGRGRGRGRGGAATSGASDRNTEQDAPAGKKAKVESTVG